MISDEQTVKTALETVSLFLIRYIKKALEMGVSVVSFAETTGTVGFLGENMYRAFLAPVISKILLDIEPCLEQSVVHLCGKTSASLEKCGCLRLTPRRVAADTNYHELLFELAAEPKTRFIGGGCANQSSMQHPIVWTGTLVQPKHYK
jgi:uroporphyrinogen-III decarboxylase